MPVVCECSIEHHDPKLVVLTGGPGAGKTAVLELVRRAFCKHVEILPEAAGIAFGGGFPRRSSKLARCVAQRTIFHVQRGLEDIVTGDRAVALALCDRGTVDGLAYWPDADAAFWSSVDAAHDAELARYTAVIHLRTPSQGQGYNHSNPLRVESALEANRIDERILAAWANHPHRIVIDTATDFLEKAARALAAIRTVLPPCCRRHVVPELDGRVAHGPEPR